MNLGLTVNAMRLVKDVYSPHEIGIIHRNTKPNNQGEIKMKNDLQSSGLAVSFFMWVHAVCRGAGTPVNDLSRTEVSYHPIAHQSPHGHVAMQR